MLRATNANNHRKLEFSAFEKYGRSYAVVVVVTTASVALAEKRDENRFIIVCGTIWREMNARIIVFDA